MVPQGKDELLQAINVNFERLRKDLRAVPSAFADERGMDGHAKNTQMSVANLVAYLIGWNELVLKWLALEASGKPIDFPETGFKWNELGRLAQKFYADHAGTNYPQLLEQLDAAKDRIIAEIESRSDDQLYGAPWYDGKWTMGRMIQLNTSSPYANARARLRKWAKSNDIPI